jgi:hypothetical protein
LFTKTSRTSDLFIFLFTIIIFSEINSVKNSYEPCLNKKESDVDFFCKIATEKATQNRLTQKISPNEYYFIKHL